MAPVQYLTDDEIKKFIDDLDKDNNGYIDYWELENKLDEVHKEIAPKAQPHHLHHESRPDEARHEFLRSVIGTRKDRIPRDEFQECVKTWEIPSLEQDRKEAQNEDEYVKKMSIWRRIRAYWAVKGPSILFMAVVVGMMIAFGTWQLVKYITYEQYRPAFGWGVVVSKTAAGVLYPTFFFIILSMSRWLATVLRRVSLISRFINWDVSQSFHIKMSIVGLFFATVHAIGHLTGSFVFGSKANRQDRVAVVIGEDAVPRAYVDYVRSIPGWSGLTSLGCFYLLAAMSMPKVRKWSYEVFQLGHLLMFPIIGLMMAHGTAALLQWPMFGYFLAFPTLLVLVERAVRVGLGFHRIKATMKVLDKETVEITAIIPSERLWKYKAGQYIFLQVPKISFFQWHPFTVSFCRGNKMMLHIKTDGNWTAKLRELGGDSGESEIEVGINGPFGAPAQRFYDFNHSIIIGAGIGVTPFSGILADLQYNDDLDHGGPNHEVDHPCHDSETTAIPPAARRSHSSSSEEATNSDNVPETPTRQGSVGPDLINKEKQPQADKASTFAEDYRRVDFHWIVRERNYLLWLSDLLNDVSMSQDWHREHEDEPHLDIRINTHVTAKQKKISTHVYRWLLEMHRTDEHPASPLTGLLNPTHFGRPDFDLILDEHYEEMLKFRASKRISTRHKEGENYEEDEELKVGVFYCGAPVVGEILADKCRELTLRGWQDGSKLEYHFMIEVFG